MDDCVRAAIVEVNDFGRNYLDEVYYHSDAAALILDRWVTKHLLLPRIYFPHMVCDAICEGLENGTLPISAWHELRNEIRWHPTDRSEHDAIQ